MLGVLGPGLVLSSYFGYMWEEGNFHIVAQEGMYRSRQLDKEELRRYIPTYRIKSIVNLRGKNPGSDWYQDEIRLAEELGVTHQDYGISANRDVADADLNAIMDILHKTPKPVLIPRKSGADRTGLITPLYQYAERRESAEEAAGQVSMWYGHLPFFGNSTAAMDRTFWRYVNTHAHS